MIRALMWVSGIGLSLFAVGFIGLSIAINAYPDSNLLGGWALLFGPIYWLGWLLVGLAVIGWVVVGLRTGIRRIRRN